MALPPFEIFDRPANCFALAIENEIGLFSETSGRPA